MTKMALKAMSRMTRAWLLPRPTTHFLMSVWTGRSRAQAAVEYILTTMVLVTCFAAMYGFIQGQLKLLFILAGKKILTTYY